MTSSPIRATARVSASYPPAETSVGSARRLVTQTLVQWGAEDLVDDAALLVSELVTNAVVHAGTEVEVSVALQADSVEIAVTDHHPVRTVPPPPPAVAETRENGRGLLLTAALSSSWGVDYTNGAKRIWFRLSLPAGPVPAPRAGLVDDGLEPDGDRPLPQVGTVRLDRDGDVLDVDPGAAALLGRNSADLVGRSWLSLCAPEDAMALLEAGGADRWQGGYRLRRADGTWLQVQARHVRLPGVDAGDPVTVCVLVDHRLRVLLADLPGTASSSAAPDGPFAGAPDALVRLGLDEILDRTITWARDALGGEGAYALLVTGESDELELRATAGLRLGLDRVPRRSGEGVTGRLARDLMPVVHDDLAATTLPQDAWLREAGVRSLATVPVLAEGRLIGLVGVTASLPAVFGVDDGARLQRAVDTVALAVQSARVAEIEQQRRGWLSYLAEASELLAGTLELDMALALVAQLVAPRLGPWCAVHVVDEAGNATASTVWHADEERLGDLQEMMRLIGPPDMPAERGVTRWLPDDPARVPAARDLAEAGGHSIALVARGRALGVLTVGHGRPGERRQLHLLSDLAPRAALAIDNALMYAERTASSAALQSSLLPPDLPDVPGVDVGVVYEATGAANMVGGDFYDFFPTRYGGRFAFAIGDVCGKGPEAAAVTGLARNALRLLSRRGDDIVSVLRHLNAAILAEGPRARFVTVVYGEGEVAPDGSVVLRYASAGHPAPVLLRADGSVAPVGTSGDLLGVFDIAETPVTSIRLEPGECLVCFTDGVTERRDGTRMLGEDGVLEVLAGGAGLSATTLARRLGAAVTDFATEATRDDVAILVLRAGSANGRFRPPAPAE